METNPIHPVWITSGALLSQFKFGFVTNWVISVNSRQGSLYCFHSSLVNFYMVRRRSVVIDIFGAHDSYLADFDFSVVRCLLNIDQDGRVTAFSVAPNFLTVVPHLNIGVLISLFISVIDCCLACGIVCGKVGASCTLITLCVCRIITNIDFKVLQALRHFRVGIMLVP